MVNEGTEEDLMEREHIIWGLPLFELVWDGEFQPCPNPKPPAEPSDNSASNHGHCTFIG